MAAVKKDIAAVVADKLGMTKKDSLEATNALFDTITDFLANGEEVQITGFGKFSVKDRAARKGRNPQTGEEIDIPATKVPHFKVGKGLREAVK